MSGQLAAFAISFGGSVVVARLLTPRDMGVFALAAAIVGLLNALAAFGLATYVVRATELRAATLESAFTLNAIVGLVLAVASLAASLVERAQAHQAVADVLAWLALAPLVGIVEFRPATMLQREMNFRALTAINLGRVVAGTLAAICTARAGHGSSSLAYGAIAASATGAALANLAAPRHACLRVSLSEARAMTIFGARMVAVSGVSTLAARLSDIILAQMLGLAALGLYTRASNISGQMFDNVYGAITRVLFVRLSSELRERGALRDVFLRGMEMITALIWPMLIGVAVLARPAIRILYGETWIGAAAPLSLLMVAQFAVTCFGMNWELFVLRDETARQARFEAIRAVVGVLAFALGCVVSIAGAATGRIAEALFGLALYHPHMRRMAGTRPGELARIYARGAALTLAAVLPSFLVMVAWGWSENTPPALVASAVALGAASWLAVLRHQDHPLFGELRRGLARGRGVMRGCQGRQP